jgi:hypothetical protein
MLCMKCKKTFEKLYFVSKEDARGTAIEGPLVCIVCFIDTFPKTVLPQPAYITERDSPRPARRLSFSATLPNPVDVAYNPALGQPAVMSVDEALQSIANAKRSTRIGFSWGPKKYNDKWLDAIKGNRVIEYAQTIEKDCEQGPGVYMATSVWKSITYANTDDTSLLVVDCRDTPTLDYSSEKNKKALAEDVHRLTNVTMTGLEIYTQLSSKACAVRAIKVYGNYWALTTGENVNVSYDIPASVKPSDLKIAKDGSPHASNYLIKIGAIKSD